MADSVDCPEFSYIGKTMEASGLLDTWFKNINVTVFDDLPSINTFIDNEALGIELSINDDSTIQAIFMFRHSTLTPPLSGSFDLSRADLKKKLGTPFFSYEKDLSEPYEFLWKSNDKWLSADGSVYISFTYNEDDSHIFQISIGNSNPFN
jgi:hypothetical protein